MPITITTTVYTYDELNTDAQEKAREWFREGNTDFNDFYAQSVIEDAVTIGALMGITVDRVYYSGFWSQGDGACFEGTYAYRKQSVKLVMEYAPQDAELHAIATALQREQRKAFYQLRASVKHSGYYCHKGCTSIEIERVDCDGYGNDEWQYDNDASATHIKDLLRDFMQWIYKQLETEYEYQNSDEQVAETIIANEYTFTATGEREG